MKSRIVVGLALSLGVLLAVVFGQGAYPAHVPTFWHSQPDLVQVTTAIALPARQNDGTIKDQTVDSAIVALQPDGTIKDEG